MDNGDDGETKKHKKKRSILRGTVTLAGGRRWARGKTRVVYADVDVTENARTNAGSTVDDIKGPP